MEDNNEQTLYGNQSHNHSPNNHPTIDTSLNWNHIAGIIAGIFALGVGYANLNNKLDQLLTVLPRTTNLEVNIRKTDSVNRELITQVQESRKEVADLKKNIERLDRQKLVYNQEQRPKKRKLIQD